MLRTIILLLFSTQLFAQDSLFISTDKPGTLWEDNPTTLGMKFTTANPGVITALKFYKTDNRTGEYQLALWDNGGTKLTIVPISTTATGWIRVPVNIPVGGGTFIIGVYNPFGRYGFRNSLYPRTKGQLSGTSGTFENGNVMPARTTGTCYYLDVVFSKTVRKPLIVNAGIDTSAIWPCDSIQVKGFVSGDAVKWSWEILNQWNDVTVTGLNTLNPIVKFKSPDSGVQMLLTATDQYNDTLFSGINVSVMPDFEPMIKRLGELIMNQTRFEMIRKWKAGE